MRAAAIYKLAAYGESAEIFIKAIGGLSAGVLIVMAAGVGWWLGLFVALLALWAVWMGKESKVRSFGIAATAAPVFTKVVAFLQPLLSWLSTWSNKTPLRPTGLYEKEDLLELLKLQARQPDNRISESELKTVRGALSLVDKSVGDVMLPRREIKWVAASDAVGPMVMDELHKSGQNRLPVVKEVTKSTVPEIVGTLYLKDLLDHLEDKGRIRDIMHSGVSYINESQDLRSAVDGFLKSGQYLLVVVNNFEEVVGVITLEDVLSQMFGGELAGGLDNYDDIRMVAAMQDRQIDSQSAEAEVE
jgi:CBS domain containing-hemolysin-like protein